MKNRHIRTLLSLILFFLSITAFSQTKEERNVEPFSKISLSIPGHLYLTQGSALKVEIEADQSKLDKIVTEVNNDNLKIRTQKGWGQNLKDVKIWITVPKVEGLYLAGSGSIIAEELVNTEEIEIKLSGSGNIKLLELRGDEIGISIAGSGDVLIAGTADEVDIAISGSGGILAEDLEVDECSIRISGSGSCEVNVKGELDARISGSGKVIYYGSAVVDATISGSGKVRKGDE